MGILYKRVILFVLISFALIGLSGCQGTDKSDGLRVMFASSPKIYYSEVYHRGRIIGAINSTDTTPGGTSMVTIRIAPEYEKYAGRHWAFYVDRGRLTAGKLNSSGQPVRSGDRLCGFLSKSAFNWFKVKTLLSDRISQAGRRAEKLHHRFAQSG